MWKLKSNKTSPYGVAAAAQRRVKKIELGECVILSLLPDAVNSKVDLSTHEGRSLVGYNYLEMED